MVPDDQVILQRATAGNTGNFVNDELEKRLVKNYKRVKEPKSKGKWAAPLR